VTIFFQGGGPGEHGRITNKQGTDGHEGAHKDISTSHKNVTEHEVGVIRRGGSVAHTVSDTEVTSQTRLHTHTNVTACMACARVSVYIGIPNYGVLHFLNLHNHFSQLLASGWHDRACVTSDSRR
jgi:hypothetical protein